jgi:hypothetical protein
MQFWRQIDDAPFAVLRRAWFEPKGASREIDLRQRQGQHFALHAPSKGIGNRDRKLKVWSLGKVTSNPLEVVTLKESRTRRGLLQEVNTRKAEE